MNTEEFEYVPFPFKLGPKVQITSVQRRPSDRPRFTLNGQKFIFCPIMGAIWPDWNERGFVLDRYDSKSSSIFRFYTHAVTGYKRFDGYHEDEIRYLVKHRLGKVKRALEKSGARVYVDDKFNFTVIRP